EHAARGNAEVVAEAIAGPQRDRALQHAIGVDMLGPPGPAIRRRVEPGRQLDEVERRVPLLVPDLTDPPGDSHAGACDTAARARQQDKPRITVVCLVGSLSRRPYLGLNGEYS